MANNQHTPERISVSTPVGKATVKKAGWDYDGNDAETYSLFKDGEFQGSMNVGEDTAIHIVHSLKNHPAMLEALKKLESTLPYEDDNMYEDAAQQRQIMDIMEEVKAAIQQAEGSNQ